jgi:serine protease Do
MKPMKRLVTIVAVGAIVVGGWRGRSILMDNYAFARTTDEVQASRQELQKVEDLSTVYRAVAKAVGPSVVKIDVIRKARREPSALRRFFQDHPGMLPDNPGDDLDPDNSPNSAGPDDDLQEEIGEGSGVVMQVDGSTVYILTNNHVAGGASDLRVTLADGRTFDDAKLVGADPKSDLAVVKIQADHVIPAQWGDSDQLQQGDIILAFGSPFGYVGSMTHGIVSAINRGNVDIIATRQNPLGYENFIQVDAPINPGNSGGPLVNLHGEVVGINTAIASRSGGFQGIGFAIPSDEAHTVYTALRDKGKVVRGYLGVEILNVADARDEAKSLGYTGDNGVIVKGDMANTPAAGKLMPGDVVTALQGKPINDVRQLRDAVALTTPGTTVTLSVYRSGKSQDVPVKIGEQPDNIDALASGRSGGEQGNPSNAIEALGIRLVTPTEDQLDHYGLDHSTKGALVIDVTHGSLAEQSGIKVGDVITQVNNTPVSSESDASNAIGKLDVNKGIRLYMQDNTGQRFVFVKPEKF